MAKGHKTGGRRKGVPNRKTAEMVAAIESSGLTPLEYMLSVLRAPLDPNEDVRLQVARENMRMEAAKAAAPYVHPKLANIELSGNKDKPLNVYVTRFFDAAKPVDPAAVPDEGMGSSGTGVPPRRTLPPPKGG